MVFVHWAFFLLSFYLWGCVHDFCQWAFVHGLLSTGILSTELSSMNICSWAFIHWTWAFVHGRLYIWAFVHRRVYIWAFVHGLLSVRILSMGFSTLSLCLWAQLLNFSICLWVFDRWICFSWVFIYGYLSMTFVRRLLSIRILSTEPEPFFMGFYSLDLDFVHRFLSWALVCWTFIHGRLYIRLLPMEFYPLGFCLWAFLHLAYVHGLLSTGLEHLFMDFCSLGFFPLGFCLRVFVLDFGPGAFAHAFFSTGLLYTNICS